MRQRRTGPELSFNVGRPTTTVYADGTRVTQTYDSEGKLQEAADQFYTDHITSIEAFPGKYSYLIGREKVAEKVAYRAKENTIHSMNVMGPFLNGDGFAVRFSLDCTSAQFGCSVMEEVAVYTVKDGKIVDERFFGLMPASQ